jgi:hypothetical protein
MEIVVVASNGVACFQEAEIKSAFSEHEYRDLRVERMTVRYVNDETAKLCQLLRTSNIAMRVVDILTTCEARSKCAHSFCRNLLDCIPLLFLVHPYLGQGQDS